MPKPRPLVTRLRAAQRMLCRDRRAIADSERRYGSGPQFDDDTMAELARYDDAIEAVAEAIRNARH